MAFKTIPNPKNKRNDLTAEFVRGILDYDYESGTFYWKYRQEMPTWWNTRFSGKMAGSNQRGYWVIFINSLPYLAHRLAWLYVYGRWPKDMIDHKNRNPSTNRINNLREANNSQNQMNTESRSNTGFKGIYFIKRGNSCRYLVTMRVNGKSKHIANCKTIEEAHLAYRAAVKLYRGEFARFE